MAKRTRTLYQIAAPKSPAATYAIQGLAASPCQVAEFSALAKETDCTSKRARQQTGAHVSRKNVTRGITWWRAFAGIGAARSAAPAHTLRARRLRLVSCANQVLFCFARATAVELMTSLSLAMKGHSCAWARRTGATREISAARRHPALSWGVLGRVFLLGVLAGVMRRLPCYRSA